LPPHAPAVQTSFEVQALPSLQLVPLTALDQLDVDVIGLQTWHALAGLTALVP
jgi:hypothetical protein